MKKTKSKTNCLLAQAQYASTVTGGARICCLGKPLLDDDGRPLRVYDKDFIEKYNSHPVVKRVRKNLEDGVKDRYCNTCWKAEDSGKTSLRQEFENDLESHNYKDLSAKDRIKRIDLRFGNKCNYICAMCNPWISSSWHKLYIDEFADSPEVNEFSDYSVLLNRLKENSTTPFAWCEKPDFWDNLFEYSQNLNFIHFGGGEPLLSDYLGDFLRQLKDANRTSINLSFVTNFSILKPEIMEQLKHFDMVLFTISLDGIEDVSEFIRHPFKWKKFLNNLELIQTKYPNITLAFESTISVLNILQLSDLVKWYDNFYKKRGIQENHGMGRMQHVLKNSVQFHFVHAPKHLSIEVLNEKQKPFLIKKLNEQLDQLNSTIEDKRLTRSFENVISYIDQLAFGIEGEPSIYIKKITTTRSLPQKIKDDLEFLGISID